MGRQASAKIENPGATGPVNYKYGNRKSYQVRIWAEELDFLSVSGLLLPTTNLRMGYLPRIRSLNLNSFSGTTELDLSSSCPNVEDLNIGNWSDLERLDINQCKATGKSGYLHQSPIDIFEYCKLAKAEGLELCRKRINHSFFERNACVTYFIL